MVVILLPYFSHLNVGYNKIKEIPAGIIPDPNAPVDPETGLPLDGAAGMDLGKPVMEPEIDGSAAEAPELPKGGEI